MEIKKMIELIKDVYKTVSNVEIGTHTLSKEVRAAQYEATGRIVAAIILSENNDEKAQA